jgi:hypothetical protein
MDPDPEDTKTSGSDSGYPTLLFIISVYLDQGPLVRSQLPHSPVGPDPPQCTAPYLQYTQHYLSINESNQNTSTGTF